MKVVCFQYRSFEEPDPKALGSCYSIHTGSTKMYRDLREVF